MAILATFKCDGCDLRMEAEGGKLPCDWSRMKVGVTISCAPGQTLDFDLPSLLRDDGDDLCPDCVRRLSTSIAPKKWSRDTMRVTPNGDGSYHVANARDDLAKGVVARWVEQDGSFAWRIDFDGEGVLSERNQGAIFEALRREVPPSVRPDPVFVSGKDDVAVPLVASLPDGDLCVPTYVLSFDGSFLTFVAADTGKETKLDLTAEQRATDRSIADLVDKVSRLREMVDALSVKAKRKRA